MDKISMWKKIRDYYHLGRNIEVANYFGVSPQTSNNWIKKGVIDLELIYNKCPDISPDWLLSHGENGPMIRPSQQYQNINGNWNTQVGGDYRQECSETIAKTLDLLSEEKKTNKKLQDQITQLVGIIDNLTASGKTSI